MPSYRLYRLDGAGKIMTAEWVDGDHDDHAVERARERCKVGAYELWDRDRLITRVDGDGRRSYPSAPPA